MCKFPVIALLFLSGCATFGNPEWCVERGGLKITIPTDRLPHEQKCKSREIFKRIIGQGSEGGNGEDSKSKQSG